MVTSLHCLNKWGSPDTREDEGKYMTLYRVPHEIALCITTIPSKIYCNRDLIDPLEQALWNVIQRDLVCELQTWDGCFNIRSKRGRKSWSLHSWGIAIDINAAWNGLGKEPTMSDKLVKCFTDAGFHWGGRWKRKDGMHFQLASI